MTESPIQRRGAPAKKGDPLSPRPPKKNMVKFGFREYEILWTRLAHHSFASCTTNKGSFYYSNDTATIRFTPTAIDGAVALVVNVPYMWVEGVSAIKTIEQAMVAHYLTIVEQAKKGQPNAEQN